MGSGEEVEESQIKGIVRKVKKGRKGRCKGRKRKVGIGKPISGVTISDINIRTTNQLLIRNSMEEAKVLCDLGE